MKSSDAAALYWQVKSVTPGEPSELGPDMWADLLTDVDYTDARVCMIALLRRSVFVGPSEIIAEVAKLRAKRIADHGEPIPPGGLTVQEDIAWRRDALRRIGAGHTIPQRRGELKPRTVRVLTKGMDS